MKEVRSHGASAFRVKQDDLDRYGVVRNQARVTGVAGGRPVLGDGTVPDVASVVWCTGFRQVLDWISLPVLGEEVWPAEYRGVVDAALGLYFCGLSFQYAFSSMISPASAVTPTTSPTRSWPLGEPEPRRRAAEGGRVR